MLTIVISPSVDNDMETSAKMIFMLFVRRGFYRGKPGRMDIGKL